MEKDIAWQEICEKFNCNSQVTKRDLASLKSCHLNLINKAKKETGASTQELFKTGGGSAIDFESSETKDFEY